MESAKSWRHEGGKFRRSRKANDEAWQQPFLGGERANVHDEENRASDRSSESRPEVPSAWGGEYSKSMIYGGLDAIVTSFALVASVSGGNLPSAAVLILGFANLVADGISMGFGDFLSDSTERDYMLSRKKLADWEIKNNLHSEILAMVGIYQEHGMEKEDAEKVVEVFSKYKDVLVQQRMAIGEGLQVGEEESPWKHGLVTFISFLSFGCTPLLTYLIASPFTDNPHIKFAAACVVTALALVFLGLAKAKISGQAYLPSALTVLLNGSIAAAAAYFVGWLLTNVFGIEEG
eukprot:TRINITY_DN12656_c0_g1_i1.p1 TRINITY_DN12656_c0_g1~~TRINITY_DN12656_c0_g1_i1.p1  ORF type:complete len:291 (-),score=55.53 TRINITY_DN12656_c0_g1_i1:144-1016(-)